MSDDKTQFTLKVYDYAVAKTAMFGSMLVSEVFGLFAVLALLGFSGAHQLAQIFLFVVYVGLVGTIGMTYTRVAYFFKVMAEAETELGFHQRDDIETKVRDNMSKDKSGRGQFFWWMMRGSNALAENYL